MAGLVASAPRGPGGPTGPGKPLEPCGPTLPGLPMGPGSSSETLIDNHKSMSNQNTFNKDEIVKIEWYVQIIAVLKIDFYSYFEASADVSYGADNKHFNKLSSYYGLSTIWPKYFCVKF